MVTLSLRERLCDHLRGCRRGGSTLVPVSFDQQTMHTMQTMPIPQSEPFTLRTLEEIEGIMSGVARSIEALDAGTYGLCEHCATPIAKQALVDNPLAVRCDAHIVQERPALFADDTDLVSEESEETEAIDPS